jgi:putative ABC transport system substrate-binding protein
LDRRSAIVRFANFATALLGAAVSAWPFPAASQRAAIPVVGYLSTGSPNERAHLLEAFRQGLKEGGYIDGHDVALEYRWAAEGHADQLARLATELVNRKVAVIVATGGTIPALAAKSATSTIPIVFTGGSDPVKLGLVESLARPGKNLTGVVNIAASLNAKRVQILRELLPRASNIAYLVNPNFPNMKSLIAEVQAASDATGTKLHVLNASTEAQIDAAFVSLKQYRVNALLVATDPLFLTRRDQIVSLAARQRMPASYPFREYADAGGLMSYGPDLADAARRVGVYTTRILKGARPAELPVIQSDKFELVVNLKTLGITISRDFLARADDVIQ